MAGPSTRHQDEVAGRNTLAMSKAGLGESLRNRLLYMEKSGPQRGERVDSCLKTDSPVLTSGQEFYRQREGATCRNSIESSNSYLKTGHVVI